MRQTKKEKIEHERKIEVAYVANSLRARIRGLEQTNRFFLKSEAEGSNFAHLIPGHIRRQADKLAEIANQIEALQQGKGEHQKNV